MISFIKGFAYSVIGIFLLLFAVFFVFSYSAATASDNFNGCEARILEHNLDGPRAIEFSDRCMGSFGYRKSSACSQVLSPVSSCYYPRWVFWAK